MMQTHIGVVLIVVALAGTTLLLVISGFRSHSSSHENKRAIERRVLESGIELELSDGSLWRTEIGFVWRHFPSGERAELELEWHLEEENDRLRLLNEWSES
jgi:hypothetical protein